MPAQRRRAAFAVASTYSLIALLVTAGSWTVPLAYRTSSPGTGDLDSVAIWVTPDSSLMFVTDKTESTVEVHDPVTNTWLMDFTGAAAGGFDRPNGIAVVTGVAAVDSTRDVLMVAERDNARISVFELPSLAYLGSIGDGILDGPMGITSHAHDDSIDIWVTDEGAETVYVFNVFGDTASVSGVVDFSFGISTVLESIVIDPVHNRAIIADEGVWDLMIYDLNGVFQTRIGSGIFVDDPEGMAIIDRCGGSGYLLVSDQKQVPTQYEIFDRATLNWIGCFTGASHDTDGLTFTHEPLPNFPNGSLFVHHAGTNVDAYDWDDVAANSPLGALRDCTGITPTDVGPGNLDDRLSVAGAHPARDHVVLQLQLDNDAVVDLWVFDVRGRRVRTLAQQQSVIAGTHTWEWNLEDDQGRRVAPGIYWARQQQSGAVRNVKLVVQR